MLSGYKLAIPPFKVKVDPKLKQQKYITYGLDPGTPPGPRSGFAGSGLFPNKEWEDLCFRCYDEGELLMCDFRTCPKVGKIVVIILCKILFDDDDIALGTIQK